MPVFQFKHFQIQQKHAALKVGTDSMILGSLCGWENPKRLLDIGTGTGVLALMCAQRFPFQEIIGLEISEEAIIDAQINAQNNPFDTKITIVNQAIQDYKPKEKFDAIISNPPFFENSSKNPNDQKSLARHTESLSFSELLQSITRLLTAEGKAWIIIPFESTENIIQLANANELFIADLITLFGKPKKPTRTILCLIKQISEIQESSLCIRTESGSYTEEYKILTKEFHDREL
ncbi:tRNA1(Val) (adenine(37)-N6)-methyltransferase [Fluviicola taffensis]|uniref:tRNA1(Val) (adenine(37)-N6)-methyltransferase n=1 Tax=Fluviicola taffensis (strain DSM 16823 / NCIMB 13979 / RW262) TaxID=755732 RepID=F2IHY8_FLUTR|nr:methyltransferase [Fluviicola taffensis]AEA45947.1 methyltransferase small [Fluviicola taffensis DSM 16823]